MTKKKHIEREKRWAIARGMERSGATGKEVLSAMMAKKKQRAASQPEAKNIPYAEYLKSDWWKKRRRQKLRSQRYKCERCGGKAWQVHHKHYRSLWRERNTDLEAICGACHENQHECLIQADAHLRSINNPS